MFYALVCTIEFYLTLFLFSVLMYGSVVRIFFILLFILFFVFVVLFFFFFFFFSSRRRHTRLTCDWSSDVCSSDLDERLDIGGVVRVTHGRSGRYDRGIWCWKRAAVDVGERQQPGVEIGRASCRERV